MRVLKSTRFEEVIGKTMEKTDDCVNESISDFLKEYIENPIRFMREYGLQVHLRNLIQKKIEASERSKCKARIRQDKSNNAPIETEHFVERTQLEVRIQPTRKDSKFITGKEMTDIVVMRGDDSPITLTCYRMGHLDIVAKVDICDVDTAIELKAACSSDKDQRHAFRLDIEKLLNLAKEAKKAGKRLIPHFVLIDKSLSIRGIAESSKQLAQSNWYEVSKSENRKWKGKGGVKFVNSSPIPVLLDNEPSNESYVHVWFLVKSDDSESGLKWEHKFVSNTLPSKP